MGKVNVTMAIPDGATTTLGALAAAVEKKMENLEKMADNMEKPKSKEEHLVDFAKAWKTLEYEMEPFKEQRRELKKNYVENGFLSKDDVRTTIQVLRMVQKNDSIDLLNSTFDIIKKKLGIGAK